MEKVYVVNNDVVDSINFVYNEYGVANCINTKQTIWNDLMKDGFFAERTNAEQNENYKQIIPYTLLKNNDGKYLLYKRTNAGGEDRLYNQHSIGMGGHINPIDILICNSQSIVSMSKNIERELTEEVPEIANNIQLNRIAVISLAETEVDRVHIGIVHVAELGDINHINYKTEDAIKLVGWYSINELYDMRSSINYESWTDRIIRSHIDGFLSL